jgi:hypothetical protein
MSTFDFLDMVGTEREPIISLSYVYDEDFAALALLGRGAVEVKPLHCALDDGILVLTREPEVHLKILITTNGGGYE